MRRRKKTLRNIRCTQFFVVYITKSQFFVGTKDEELKAEEKRSTMTTESTTKKKLANGEAFTLNIY